MGTSVAFKAGTMITETHCTNKEVEAQTGKVTEFILQS